MSTGECPWLPSLWVTLPRLQGPVDSPHFRQCHILWRVQTANVCIFVLFSFPEEGRSASPSLEKRCSQAAQKQRFNLKIDLSLGHMSTSQPKLRFQVVFPLGRLFSPLGRTSQCRGACCFSTMQKSRKEKKSNGKLQWEMRENKHQLAVLHKLCVKSIRMNAQYCITSVQILCKSILAWLLNCQLVCKLPQVCPWPNLSSPHHSMGQ